MNVILFYLNSKFSREEVDKVQCIPMSHPCTVDDKFFEKAKGKNNVMVDFSLKYNDLKRLIDVSNTFLILDHHKSAQEDLQSVDENLKVFRMDKSGAGLAWEYFFPQTPPPRVVVFIQDQDIWTFKDPDTKPFNTIFHGLKQTYDLWLQFVQDENLVQKTIDDGRTTLKYEDTLVNNTCKWAGQSKIHDMNGKYVIIASINSTTLVSQMGNTLLQKDHYPYADLSLIYSIKNGKTKFSMRSDDTRYDVSAIAKTFPKGGGHRNAAGFDLEGRYDCMPYEVIINDEVVDGEVPIEKVRVFMPYPVVEDGELLLKAMKDSLVDGVITLPLKLSKIPDTDLNTAKFKELFRHKFTTNTVDLKCGDWSLSINLS